MWIRDWDAEMEHYAVLRNLYEDAVGWLKYAEGKNAALAALAAGSFYITFRLLASQDNEAFFLVLSISSVFFALSLLFCIVSFLPITNPKFEHLLEMHSKRHDRGNLFFFFDLAMFSESTLLNNLGLPNETQTNKQSLEFQLANQIIANSRVARRKLIFFEFGAWLYLSGLASPIVAFLLFWAVGGIKRIGHPMAHE
jgi:hypothetical protein